MNQLQLIATARTDTGDCPSCKHHPPNNRAWRDRAHKGPALCLNPDSTIRQLRFSGRCPGYEYFSGEDAA